MVGVTAVARCCLLVALLGASAGCVVEGTADTVVVVEDELGLLTVQWFVDGTTSPGACSFYGATDLRLTVYDFTGAFYTDAFAPCEAFALTVRLPVGDYLADAELVDFYGRPVSLAVEIDDIFIDPGTELVVTVDFPASSIF